MAQLIWSPLATDDLDRICAGIARNSPANACTFAAEVYALAGTIPGQPYLGAMVPEYGDPDLRERQHHNHRILYRFHGTDVEIVTIYHGARRLPRTPPG